MIYLDNCATSQLREEVYETMIESLKEDFYNPSSLYNEGFKTEKKIKEARTIVGEFLNVPADDIYFTSGGTESNNLAIKMALKKNKHKKGHIISSAVEHASVMNHMKALEEEGYRVSYLSIDENGDIDLDQLEDLIGEDTFLISLMHVNSELGSILSVDRVGEIIARKKPDISFHVDGVQAFGKLPLDLRSLAVDFYSFSSHKVYGPKGLGGLYVNPKKDFQQVIYGGNQESGIRSGTENVPAIIAFGRAVEILRERGQEEREHVASIKEYFIGRMKEEISDINIHCENGRTSPYVVNLSILDIRAEVLLHYLAQEDIFISTSSACSSHDTQKSHVLLALGLSNREIEGTIRICFSYDISRDDIDYTVEKIRKYTEEIREIMR